MVSTASRTILGVDPGLTRCGIGVVRSGSGRHVELVRAGVIRTDRELELSIRLQRLELALDRLIIAHKPDAIAVERVFSQHNVRTAMATAQASAIALLVAARHGTQVAMHTPSEVKAAVTGSGRADKKQVGHMVARVLGLAEAPSPPDAADALALAICHVWRGHGVHRLAAAAAASGGAR